VYVGRKTVVVVGVIMFSVIGDQRVLRLDRSIKVTVSLTIAVADIDICSVL